jgi:peptide deformylase
MPGVTEEIERHAHVRMSYQDLSGAEKNLIDRTWDFRVKFF